MNDIDWHEVLRRYFNDPHADLPTLEDRLREKSETYSACELAYVCATNALKLGFEQASLALA